MKIIIDMNIYKGNYDLYNNIDNIEHMDSIFNIRDYVLLYCVIFIGESIRYINNNIYGIKINLSSKYNRRSKII